MGEGMSIQILASVEMVNFVPHAGGDFPSHTRHCQPVGLRERIEFILKREGVSQRELSRRSGLTEVHVGQILRRLAQDEEAPVETKTVSAIARGGKVSAAWLLSGRGSPDDHEEPEAQTPSTAPEFVTRPQFQNLPDWPELLDRAKALDPELPPWVWELMARTSPILSAPPTPVMVAELGRWMLRHESLVRSREPRKETGPQDAAKPRRK